MTVAPQLTIAGSNDLASEMARHALSAGLADPVYLWRDLRDPVAADTPVIIVAEPDERASFAGAAVEARASVVTLPISAIDGDLTRAVESGSLSQISRLHGLPALARLHRDAVDGLDGRRYGIYAAHRLPRNHAEQVSTALLDLLVFVGSLGDGRVSSFRATVAPFDADNDGWFLIARFENDTIATIEVSAVLPEADEPDGDLLVEVTGSEAVLRAEPERQSVLIIGREGLVKQPWYAEPVGPLLEHALSALQADSTAQQVSLISLFDSLEIAAESDGFVAIDLGGRSSG